MCVACLLSQAYQHEYAQQMNHVSHAVEQARRGIEQAWIDMGLGPDAPLRADFDRKFHS